MGLLHATIINVRDVDPKYAGMLREGETIVHAYKAVRDYILFTDSRVFVVNVQGITGRKVSLKTIPYRSVNAFSVETAGSFDLDAELKLFVSGSPPIEIEFGKDADVTRLGQFLADKVLG